MILTTLTLFDYVKKFYYEKKQNFKGINMFFSIIKAVSNINLTEE